MTFLISTLLLPIQAEEEPNDSLDDPDPLAEEWTYGHVTYHYGDLDVDFYSSRIPQNGVLIITLKKLDTDFYSDIDMDIYDQFHEEHNEPRGISLDIPGEEQRAVIYNKKGMDTMYFMVFGDGNYSIKSHSMILPEEGDWPDDDPDRTIMEDESVEGTVYSYAFEGIDITDIDHYYFDIKELRSSRSWSRYDELRVNITLEKTDDGPGEILLHNGFDSSRYYEGYSISLNLTAPHERSTLGYDIDSSSYLSCWVRGVGSYKLTVNITNIEEADEWTDEEDSDDEDLDGFGDWGIILLLCGLGAYPFIFIAFIFAVVKISSGKKTEEAKEAPSQKKKFPERKGPTRRQDLSDK